MFDSLVVTRTQKPGARALLGLPAAVVFHFAVGAAYFAATLYAVPEIAPPSYPIVLAPPAPPVVLVTRKEFERRQNATDRDRQQRREPSEIQAPREVPSEVKPSDATPDTGAGVPHLTGLEEVVEDLPPGYVEPALMGPVPMVPVYSLLEVPHLLSRVDPLYPPALQMMGTSGRVVLELEVDETGAVAAVRIVSSPHPLLTQAAEAAVWQWRYTRPLAPGGGAARVLLTVTLHFRLR